MAGRRSGPCSRAAAVDRAARHARCRHHVEPRPRQQLLVERRAHGWPPQGQRGRAGRMLDSPAAGDEIRVLFVQGSNPAATCPNQKVVHAGLAREDVFTVVHDQVLTDTRALRRRRASRDDTLRSRGHRRVVRHVRPAARHGRHRPSRREPHERRARVGIATTTGLTATRFSSDPVALMIEGLNGAAPPEAGTAGVPRAGHDGAVPRHVPLVRRRPGAVGAVVAARAGSAVVPNRSSPTTRSRSSRRRPIARSTRCSVSSTPPRRPSACRSTTLSRPGRDGR